MQEMIYMLALIICATVSFISCLIYIGIRLFSHNVENYWLTCWAIASVSTVLLYICI